MPDQSASRLICLPAEIRACILEELLIQRNDQGFKPANHRFCANILRTCTQLHREGTGILYGSNTFQAHPSLLAAFPRFLLSATTLLPPITTPRLAALIRHFHVCVRLDTDPRFSRAQVEASFSGAEEVCVDVFQAMFNSCDFGVLELFEGVRGVGRASVRGSVGDGEYARWLERCMMSPAGAEVVPFAERWIGGSQACDAWVRRHQHRRDAAGGVDA